MRTLLEFTRPHPQVYNKFKSTGDISYAGKRRQVDFPSVDGNYVAHFGETDPGQAFWWLTSKDNKDGRMEFKQFKKYKQALQYGLDRYAINLTGLKSLFQANSRQPKGSEKIDSFYWKGMK